MCMTSNSCRRYDFIFILERKKLNPANCYASKRVWADVLPVTLIERLFSYLVLNYAFKTSAHKCYVYVIHGTLSATFKSNVLSFFKCYWMFQNIQMKHSHNACKMIQCNVPLMFVHLIKKKHFNTFKKLDVLKVQKTFRNNVFITHWECK